MSRLTAILSHLVLSLAALAGMTRLSAAEHTSPTNLPGLLCFWDFQDGPDGLRSKGRHAYVLTERNGPIESAADGVFGNHALRIKRGQWLRIPGKDCPELNLHGEAHVTVAAWIKRECDAPWQYIAGVWNERDCRRQYALFTCGHKQSSSKTLERTEARHQTHGYVSDVGGATPGKPFCFSYATGKSKIEEGAWHTIAFTYDHRDITVYFDGEVDYNGDCNPFPWNKAIFTPPGEPTDFTVAQRALPSWPGYPELQAPPHKEGFCGLLGGLAVYDRALDGEEIRRLHMTPAEHERRTKHLFVDRAYVQRLEGVDQVFRQPVKERGPVVAPDRAWEQGRLHLWNAPVWSKERSRWQMWYYGGDDLLPLYAESPDGLRWDKPRLGLVDWNGSTQNNIINLGFKIRSPKENRIVLLRDDLETDSARRFKGLVRAGAQLVALVSADGLNWKRLESNPIPSDDEYRLGYDALNHRFLATVKRSGQGSGHAAGNHPLSQFGRRVALSTSRDFVRWSEPELILWGDQEDQQLGRKRIREAIEDADRRAPTVVCPSEFYTDIYNMPLFTYEGLYLGLPVIFNQSGRYSHSTGASQDGILYASLVASRDLRHWDRLNRQPFISHSRLSDPQNYDHAMIQATQPVRRGDELWFYYTGTRFTHLKRELIEQAGLRKSPDEPLGAIFLARLRLDGFASLCAGPQPGSVLTVPVKVAARKLCVNADAKAGELRVEIRDAKDGTAMPGYALEAAGPVREDTTCVPIRWQQKSDVSELAGREVRLYFSLRNAHLYSFWFDD